MPQDEAVRVHVCQDAAVDFDDLYGEVGRLFCARVGLVSLAGHEGLFGCADVGPGEQAVEVFGNTHASHAEDAVHSQGIEGQVEFGEAHAIGEEADTGHTALVAFGDELRPFHGCWCLEEGGVTGEDDLDVVCPHDWTRMKNCRIPGIDHRQADDQAGRIRKGVDNLQG